MAEYKRFGVSAPLEASGWLEEEDLRAKEEEDMRLRELRAQRRRERQAVTENRKQHEARALKLYESEYGTSRGEWDRGMYYGRQMARGGADALSMIPDIGMDVARYAASDPRLSDLNLFEKPSGEESLLRKKFRTGESFSPDIQDLVGLRPEEEDLSRDDRERIFGTAARATPVLASLITGGAPLISSTIATRAPGFAKKTKWVNDILEYGLLGGVLSRLATMGIESPLRFKSLGSVTPLQKHSWKATGRGGKAGAKEAAAGESMSFEEWYGLRNKDPRSRGF